MIFYAFLVAITYYLICWLTFGFGITNFQRPIVVGPIVGLVLGDLGTGVIIGGTLESIFLGVMAVGGQAPADATIAAAVGTAFAILTKADINTVTAIAVPVAMLGIMLNNLMASIVIPLFIPKMDAYAEKGDYISLTRFHWIISLLQSRLFQAFAVFFAVWFGSDSLNIIIDKIPQVLTHGLQAGGKMLPAVGFALLFNMLYNKKVFPFFMLGFVLVAYLKLPSIAIAILAIIYAVTQYYNSQDNHKSVDLNSNSEGEFFNE